MIKTSSIKACNYFSLIGSQAWFSCFCLFQLPGLLAATLSEQHPLPCTPVSVTPKLTEQSIFCHSHRGPLPSQTTAVHFWVRVQERTGNWILNSESQVHLSDPGAWSETTDPTACGHPVASHVFSPLCFGQRSCAECSKAKCSLPWREKMHQHFSFSTNPSFPLQSVHCALDSAKGAFRRVVPLLHGSAWVQSCTLIPLSSISSLLLRRALASVPVVLTEEQEDGLRCWARDNLTACLCFYLAWMGNERSFNLLQASSREVLPGVRS